jgi:signal transduction histidine kinase
MGIRKKLAGLVLLALVPLLVLDGVQIFTRFSHRRNEEQQANVEFSEAIGAAFANYLNSLWATELALGLGISHEAPLSAGETEQLMTTQLQAHPGVKRFLWLNPEGVVIASTDPRGRELRMDDRDYFQRIVAGESTSVSELMQSRVAGGEPVVIASRGIRRGDRLVGVIVATLDVTRMDVVLPVARSGDRTFGLVDSAGMIVYRSTEPDLPWERRHISSDGPALGALQGQRTMAAHYRTVDGSLRIGAATPVTAIGWAAFASSPEADVLALAWQDAWWDILFVLLAVMLSAAGVTLVGNRFVQPILALQGSALAISRGELGARVAAPGTDEVGAAARTFNEMADRIQRSEVQLRSRAEQQSALALLGQHALAEMTPCQVMDEAVHIVMEQLQVEYCAIQELLGDGQTLMTRAAGGWPRQATAGLRPLCASSQAGYTLQAGDPVVVEAMAAEQRFPVPDDWREAGVISGLSVVIHGPDRPLGVLAVHTLTRRRFSSDDVHFVQAVANVLGMAIQRNQAEAERGLLLAGAQRARAEAEEAQLRLYSLVMKSPAMIWDLKGPEHTFELINPCSQEELGERQVVGLPLRQALPELAERGLGKILDRVYASGEPFEAKEVAYLSTRRAVGERWFNLLCLPERVPGGPVEGVLVYAQEVTEQVRARKAIEAMAADLHTRARQQAAVANLGTVALEATLTAIPWANMAAKVLAEILDVDLCSMIELRPDRETFSMRAGWGWNTEVYGNRVAHISDGGYAGCGLKLGGPLMVEDWRTETRFAKPPKMHGYGIISSAMVVIPGQHRPLGLVAVHSRQARTFTEDDVHFLQAVAHLLGATLERAIAARRLNVQYTVSRLLTQAASFAEAAPKLLQVVCEGIQWDVGALWLADDSGEHLVCAEMWRQPGVSESEFTVLTQRGKVLPGFGVLGQVWQQGDLVWLPDMTTAPTMVRRDAAAQAGLRAGIWVPIRVEGQVVGALEFFGREGWKRSEETASMLVAISSLVGQFLERVRAEDALRTLNAELERRVSDRTAELAAANQELEAFSYSVSHDLRSPLRTIDGFSQAILEDFGAALDEECQDYLRRIRGASQRMSQLIDDLLRLSRVMRTEMRREEVDLSQLARTVAADLQRASPGRQGVQFAIADGIKANGDERLLRVALENLLGNAWKFSSRQEEANIAFGQMEQHGRAVYFVRDNGAGFDMAYADKLFGAFQRLHSPAEFEGSGIGLATVQRIIRRHGGQVWAEGRVGQGAVFFFTLQPEGAVVDGGQTHFAGGG